MNYIEQLYDELYRKFNFSFIGLKNTIENYMITTDIFNKKEIVVDKFTDEIIEDELIVSRMKFARMWILATMFKRDNTTSISEEFIFNDEIEIAFSEPLELLYNLLMESLKYQVDNSIYINPIEIKKYLKNNNCDWLYQNEIVDYFFNSNENEIILNNWVKMVIKNEMPLIVEELKYK